MRDGGDLAFDTRVTIQEVKCHAPTGMNSGEKKWLDPASSRPITAHGLRATFRTWEEEVTTVPTL
jgi:hypothetical protein